jgi:hypothetical protein
VSLLLYFTEYLPLHGSVFYGGCVNDSNPPTLHRPNTVRLESHAADTLVFIRASMEGAMALALPGSAGIALGIIGLLAMALSASVALHDRWIEIWLLAGLLAAAVGSILVVRESSLRGLKLAGRPLRRFALCLFPSLFAGLVMTGVHWSSGNLHAIAGTWLILYGCALLAASATTIRTIGIMGACFVSLGLVTLGLPDTWHNAALGAGFGGVHVLFGIIIGRMSHGRQT